MFNKKRFILYAILIAIVIIIPICIFSDLKSVDKSSVVSEMHIYNISIIESNQRYIWKQSEKNKLSYELVLAIYQTESENTSLFNNINEDIEKLAYFRDYWTELGYSDEVVYNLMLISKERGINGCLNFMKNSDSYDLNNYVQKVTEYKLRLDQMSLADNI